MLYEVECELTYVRVLKIRAKSKEEALNKAELKWKEYKGCIGINGGDISDIKAIESEENDHNT